MTSQIKKIILAFAILMAALSIGILYKTTSELRTSYMSLAEVVIQQNKLIEEHEIILTAISDDYPPKKALGDRDWCLGRTCLPE